MVMRPYSAVFFPFVFIGSVSFAQLPQAGAEVEIAGVKIFAPNQIQQQTDPGLTRLAQAYLTAWLDLQTKTFTNILPSLNPVVDRRTIRSAFDNLARLKDGYFNVRLEMVRRERRFWGEELGVTERQVEVFTTRKGELLKHFNTLRKDCETLTGSVCETLPKEGAGEPVPPLTGEAPEIEQRLRTLLIQLVSSRRELEEVETNIKDGQMKIERILSALDANEAELNRLQIQFDAVYQRELERFLK